MLPLHHKTVRYACGLEPATSWVKARCASQFHQRIVSGESESRTRRPAFADHLGSNEVASPNCRLSKAEAVRVELTSPLEPHRFEPCCYAGWRASMAVVRGVDPPRSRRAPRFKLGCQAAGGTTTAEGLGPWVPYRALRLSTPLQSPLCHSSVASPARFERALAA